jgi:hypothetical protein
MEIPGDIFISHNKEPDMYSVQDEAGVWPKRRRTGGFVRGSGGVGAVAFSVSTRRQAELLAELERLTTMMPGVTITRSQRNGRQVTALVRGGRGAPAFAEIASGAHLQVRVPRALASALQRSGWVAAPVENQGDGAVHLHLPRNAAEARVIGEILRCAAEAAALHEDDPPPRPAPLASRARDMNQEPAALPAA